MRVLITGAPGRVASRLGARDPAGDVRLFVGRRARGPDAQSLDLRDRDAARDLVADFRPDVVVHLAAVTGSAAEVNPAETADLNVSATRALAQSAIATGAKRFVFASTSAVYGDGYRTPISETANPQPRSLYAETKLEAEVALADLAAVSGLEVIALRIFNIYGTGFEDSLVSKLKASTPENPVALRGFDSFVRDYTDAEDVALALDVATHAPLPAGYTVLNVGTGVATSNRALVGVLGRRRTVHYTVDDAPVSYSCAEVSQLRRVLGLTLPPLG